MGITGAVLISAIFVSIEAVMLWVAISSLGNTEDI